MNVMSRLPVFLLAVALLPACSDSTDPTASQAKAQPPTTPPAAEPQATDGDSLPSIVMTPPPAPSSVTNKPKPSGPHGQQDPHGGLDPERLIKVALQHDQEGRYELALKTLAEGIARFPDAASLYGVRASLRLQNQQTSLALSDLEKAVELAPDDAAIRVNRAQAYRAFGRLDEALSDLDVAVQSNPDLVPARFNRGALLYARGDFDKALADFEHCIAVDPHAPAPYFNRASTYWELGRSDEALADLQRFVDLADDAEWKKAAEDLMQNWKTALSREAGAAKTDS